MAQAAPICTAIQQTDVLSTIGRTPLVRLMHVTADLPGIEIYGKAEYTNPGGSVKDRPALNMILEGERSGKLTHDLVILDSTSGNTGIAYAMIAAAKHYHVKLCLPANASLERQRILKAYGAEVVLTDAAEGSDGAIRKCREIYNADPGRYFYPDQYNNPANWMAHFETTGPEIIEQTAGGVTHFVASMGTSGTFMGVTRRMRRDLPAAMVIVTDGQDRIGVLAEGRRRALDHVGSEVGEHHQSVRPGDGDREVDDLDAGEGAGHDARS